MKLAHYLASRGLDKALIENLLPYIPNKSPEVSCGVFYDAPSIMNPDKWFYWPSQTRFVVVGQCPNGDGVAIDTEGEPGAVFYVAHELLGSGRPLRELVVRVAGSPSDYHLKLLEDAFPVDYWEAKKRNTEPTAPPHRRSARRGAARLPPKRGGR